MRAPPRTRTFALLVAASLGAHAAAAAVPRALHVGEPPPKVETARKAGLAGRAEAVAGPVFVAAERRALVEEARRERAEGRLRLGAFLLRAGALEARAEGRPLDRAAAEARYEARLARLRAAAERGDLRRAVPEAMGDLHYFGRAGGTMARALLEGGGSCEPLSHLVAAALHDAGFAERAFLRFYGGGSEGGATHLAATLTDGAAEHDLLAGTPARPGGARFAAAELVEVYARAHGLAPPLVAAGTSGGGGGEASAARAPTLADGYPDNRDTFPGAVPLYADRGVIAPSAAAAAARVPALDATDCAFFVRVASLDPPALTVAGAGEGFGVELRRAPSGPQLDRIFGLVQAVERALPAPGRGADPADLLMGQACLAALYDQAAVGFGLTGARDLADMATDRRRAAVTAGEALLAGLDWDSPAGARVLDRLAGRYAGRSWLLLLLRGGDAPVLRLGVDEGQDSWGRITLVAALLIAPATRARALGIVERFSPRQKLEVMHEVFHAHDHQRPWASNYALDGAGDGEFSRVYGVFRGVAWGLWEGARPQEETLDAMLHEAERARLGRPWVDALVEYYGRNAVALHQSRADWPVFAPAFKRWLRLHDFTDTEVWKGALADVEEGSR
jgi:hypothetical protein